MPTLGAYIRRRRLELGLTQEALADMIGDNTRQADVSRLENDRVTLPRRARLEAIARALQVSPGELLARSGWEGGEAIDRSSIDGSAVTGLAERVAQLTDELPDDAADASQHQRVIEDALPTITETVAQMHELVHETESLLDETQARVDAVKQRDVVG